MLCWGEFPAGLSNRAQCKIPSGTQRSGHGGKRRSKGAGGAFPEREEAEQSGLCDDADGGEMLCWGEFPAGLSARQGHAAAQAAYKYFCGANILKWAGFACPFELYTGSL